MEEILKFLVLFLELSSFVHPAAGQLAKAGEQLINRCKACNVFSLFVRIWVLVVSRENPQRAIGHEENQI